MDPLLFHATSGKWNANRIWTPDTDSITYDDQHYTKHDSHVCVYVCMYMYVYVYR